MTESRSMVRPVAVQALSTKQKHHVSTLASDESRSLHDNGKTSGDEREEDGDVDSTTGTESDDSVATPEQSPPQRRHAVLHGKEAFKAPAIGRFDSDGNWTWTIPSIGCDVRPRSQREGLVEEMIKRIGALASSSLNRHDRAKIAMTGSVKGRSGKRRASVGLRKGFVDKHELSDEDEDDQLDLVGFTSYHSCDDSRHSEGHSIVVPVRIRVEDDSSSDESDGGVITVSSGESDPEARRRASINMLQRLGRSVAIPERFDSARQLGKEAPRRPPSLDEISHRVVAGSSGGRGDSASDAAAQQRSVSCPSPLPLLRERFGQVEVMVTPPTPQMPTEKIQGVRFKRPNMPERAFSTDCFGQLIPPAFDVAPGRQRMIDERKRQAKDWLDKFNSQQRQGQGLNLQLGAGDIAPPMADATRAAAIITPSSLTRSTSCFSQASESARQQPGGPPIPPRQRSFGRQITGPPSINIAVPIKEPAVGTMSLGYGRPTIPSRIQGQVADIPPRVKSPVNVPADEVDSRVQTTRRRSLVARIGLRKPSKDLSGTAREPIPML